jgi:hypothetical protein
MARGDQGGFGVVGVGGERCLDGAQPRHRQGNVVVLQFLLIQRPDASGDVVDLAVRFREFCRPVARRRSTIPGTPQTVKQPYQRQSCPSMTRGYVGAHDAGAWIVPCTLRL